MLPKQVKQLHNVIIEMCALQFTHQIGSYSMIKLSIFFQNAG